MDWFSNLLIFMNSINPSWLIKILNITFIKNKILYHISRYQKIIYSLSKVDHHIDAFLITYYWFNTRKKRRKTLLVEKQKIKQRPEKSSSRLLPNRVFRDGRKWSNRVASLLIGQWPRETVDRQRVHDWFC